MTRMLLLGVGVPWALAACAPSSEATPDEPVVPAVGAVDCKTTTYPTEDVVEPMELGEVIAPYRWPDASRREDGVAVSLNLREVPCATDDDIDWSPFDVLLFVSIPAW